MAIVFFVTFQTRSSSLENIIHLINKAISFLMGVVFTLAVPGHDPLQDG